MGWPSTLKTRPSVAGPTGTLIGVPVSLAARAAREAVGSGHGDGAHPVVAQVLLDLDDQGIALALDLDRVEDCGQLPGRKLDVDHRAGDRNHSSGRRCGYCHVLTNPPWSFTAPGRRSRFRSSRG